MSWDAWALTNEGHLLHKGEQAEGYCPPLKKDDLIEMVVDTSEGTVSFTINGEPRGIAFENNHFKS